MTPRAATRRHTVRLFARGLSAELGLELEPVFLRTSTLIHVKTTEYLPDVRTAKHPRWLDKRISLTGTLCQARRQANQLQWKKIDGSRPEDREMLDSRAGSGRPDALCWSIGKRCASGSSSGMTPQEHYDEYDSNNDNNLTQSERDQAYRNMATDGDRGVMRAEFKRRWRRLRRQRTTLGSRRARSVCRRR